MTIVVTGATGHLGRLVVESLLGRGASPGDVVATGRNAQRLAELAERSACARPSPTTPTPPPFDAAFEVPTACCSSPLRRTYTG